MEEDKSVSVMEEGGWNSYSADCILADLHEFASLYIRDAKKREMWTFVVDQMNYWTKMKQVATELDLSAVVERSNVILDNLQKAIDWMNEKAFMLDEHSDLAYLLPRKQ